MVAGYAWDWNSKKISHYMILKFREYKTMESLCRGMGPFEKSH